MMVEIGWVMLATACMAVLAAALGSVFPAAYRPWWHPLQRAQPTAPRAHASAAEFDPHLAETQPVTVPLEVVDTLDRRAQPLPFVGKDRRKVAHASERQQTRRRGNGH